MTASNWIEEGRTLLEKLDVTGAETKFKNALAVDSQSVEAYLWLGKTALMRTNIVQAEEYLNRALSMEPDNAEVMALKGVCELQKGHPGNALQLLEGAVKQNPDLEMIYSNMAQCLRMLGRGREAQEAAGRALHLNTNNARANFEMAEILITQNKIEEALSHYASAIRNNPYFVEAYLALGMTLSLIGKTNEAISTYYAALSYLPDAHAVRDQLCALLFLQKDLDAAIEESNESIRRRNDYGDHLRLGIYLLAAGKFEAAEKAFRDSIDMNPKSWEGHYNLAELYRSANLPDEARFEYEKALESGSDTWKTWNGMGIWLLYYGNQPEEAVRHFSRALELEPGRPEAQLNLALSRAALRDWDLAEKSCREAMKEANRNSALYPEAKRLLEAIAIEQNHSSPEGS
jgi:tetratricopeptide (TPR) repeat protein